MLDWKRGYPLTSPLSAALAVLLGGLQAQAQTGSSLGSMAKAAHLNFGLAVGGQFFSGDQRYRDIIKSEFSMFVNENDMKFDMVEPSRGRFNFQRPDQVVAFAEADGIKMRGHTLVWHQQSGWASNAKLTRDEMLSVLRNHIETVVGRYKGRILEWDVVNEAINDGGDGTMRSTFWRTQIGDDYIDSAFVIAHRADPTAFLYYNDYAADGLNPKSNAIYNLVKRMKEKGLPIHGVGLQAHGTRSTNKADISTNIKRLGELGLRVSITEVDIEDPSGDTRPWVDLLGACLENFNCTSFLTWGLDDAHSWLTKNGTCNCLLYDTGLRPKTALRNALLEKLAGADPVVTAARKSFIGRTTSASGQLDRNGPGRNGVLESGPVTGKGFSGLRFRFPGANPDLYDLKGKRM